MTLINEIVKVSGAIKPIDLHMLCNAAGGYFIGTQKECNDFIKENNLTVVEKLKECISTEVKIVCANDYYGK